MKFKKLKSIKISEEVVNQILKKIEEGSIKEKEKLPIESDLAKSFGISRTAVREGMQRLSAMDIIEILPGRGTFIKKIPKKSVFILKKERISDRVLMDVIEFRKILEPKIVEIVINKIDRNGMKKLEKCLILHKEGLIGGVFPAKGDVLFHETLALLTGNQFIIELLDDIRSLIINVTARVDYKSKYKKSLEFHEEIYKNILNKNKEGASKSMENHINWINEILMESISKNKKSKAKKNNSKKV